MREAVCEAAAVESAIFRQRILKPQIHGHSGGLHRSRQQHIGRARHPRGRSHRTAPPQHGARPAVRVDRGAAIVRDRHGNVLGCTPMGQLVSRVRGHTVQLVAPLAHALSPGPAQKKDGEPTPLQSAQRSDTRRCARADAAVPTAAGTPTSGDAWRSARPHGIAGADRLRTPAPLWDFPSGIRPADGKPFSKPHRRRFSDYGAMDAGLRSGVAKHRRVGAGHWHG